MIELKCPHCGGINVEFEDECDTDINVDGGYVIQRYGCFDCDSNFYICINLEPATIEIAKSKRGKYETIYENKGMINNEICKD